MFPPNPLRLVCLLLSSLLRLVCLVCHTSSGSFAWSIILVGLVFLVHHTCWARLPDTIVPAQARLPDTIVPAQARLPVTTLPRLVCLLQPCSGSYACYNPAQARLPVTTLLRLVCLLQPCSGSSACYYRTLLRLVCPSIIPAQARLPDLLRLVCQLLSSLLRLAFLVYHTRSARLLGTSTPVGSCSLLVTTLPSAYYLYLPLGSLPEDPPLSSTGAVCPLPPLPPLYYTVPVRISPI